MRMILLPHGATCYELAGPREGAVVVLLHGATAPLWTWDAQVAPLVAEGFRVLRYDMFGKGLSDCPRARYDRAFFCEQLLGLLDALDLQAPVHLAGFSFGGAIAAHFSMLHPERVESLALVAPLLDFGESARLVRLARLPLLGGPLLRLLLPRQAGARVARLWQGSARAGQYAALFAQQLARPEFQRAFLAFLRSDALGDYSAAYRALGDAGREGLLVWGNADEDIPRAHIWRILQLNPHLHGREIDGATHGIPFQHAERLGEMLVDHLKGNAGSAYAATELAGLGR
ncbi:MULTISPECIES: alpha/beta hydrolase [Ramlibacter]|uniref:Alpha/beta hydrolase n=1 Tax=Ramlibacter aquaticus TaxID=2780094 RepID=A0ABR9SDG3_9BURK|nr:MULTISPECIES: alpha/beta hydrolase [Ramlibacter]MBE7940368.1 alpha/beta hydrolase [Ramlibacter aquaticus]